MKRIASIFANLIILLTTIISAAQENSSAAAIEGTKSPTFEEAVRNVRSIIITDWEHGSKHMLEREMNALEKIKRADPTYDCVFLELEPKATDAIQKYVAGADYTETVGIWISESSHLLKVPFVNVIPDWYLTQIYKIGFKMIGADVDWSSDLGKKLVPLVQALSKKSISAGDYPLLIGARSRVIAENLILGLRNGTCRKAVLIVGEDHLENIGMKPVQQYLQEAGISGYLWIPSWDK